jgi:hypothetical protein
MDAIKLVTFNPPTFLGEVIIETDNKFGVKLFINEYAYLHLGV